MSPPTETSVKVLAIGSAAGSIRDLFSKIQAIDAKHGKFDLVLCIGNFFGPPKDNEDEDSEDEDVMQLLSGALDAPLECFVMQGEYPLPKPVVEKFAKTGGALSKNVFLLHKSGVMSTANGLRIACLGGVYDSNLYAASESAHGFTSPYFTSVTVDKLLANTMTKSPPTPSSSNASYNSLAAIRSSTASSQFIDILLTNTFPAQVTAFSAAPLPTVGFPPDAWQAEPVAEVVRRIKPRYHFVAGGGPEVKGTSSMFWEREPFIWADEGGRVTRLVSLGAFGGPAPASGKKQRWFYAFNIAPHTTTSPPPVRPANATLNPFTEFRGMKRPPQNEEGDGVDFRWGQQGRGQGNKRGRIEHESGDKPPEGYKCKICQGTDHFINDCPEREKPKEGYICRICKEPGHFVRDCPTKHQVGDTGGRKPREGYVCRACGSELHYIEDCPAAKVPRQKRAPPKEIAPDTCWFCLSNPSLAKHLIVSIGAECYLSLPKGQIMPTHTAGNYPNAVVPRVPGGGHVLIIPISHYPTYRTIPTDLAEPIIQETERYKAALTKYFAQYDAHPVVFEIGRLTSKGGHAHIHVVPIPRSFSAEAIANAYLEDAKMLNFELTYGEVTAETGPGDRGYFQVELPDGRKLVHWLRDRSGFHINFGRQVLTNMLGMPERLNWTECGQSDGEDQADAQAFKTAFVSFDPSL